MTHEELQAIKARAEAATPGPWRWESAGGGDYDYLYASDGSRVHSDGSACGEYGPDIDTAGPDATFIAHARTDVPALVAEVERLRELCQRGGKLLSAAWYDAPAGTISDVKALAGELEVAGRE